MLLLGLLPAKLIEVQPLLLEHQPNQIRGEPVGRIELEETRARDQLDLGVPLRPKILVLCLYASHRLDELRESNKTTSERFSERLLLGAQQDLDVLHAPRD